MKARAILVCLALPLGACTWVQPAPGALRVRAVEASAVGGCKKLGEASARTTKQLWIFTRGDRTVQEELLTLARNEAVTLGGDTVVATGPPVHGSQLFDVYRCGR